MFDYYIELALRSLRSNAVLTALTIIAIGVGIGTSMTVFTLFRALSGDPIPHKSSQLFLPLIDNWGPNASIPEEWRTQLSYLDAMALMRAQRGSRQTATYATSVTVTPSATTTTPFAAVGRAAYTDFFQMFEVPFREGNPWSRADDQARSNVVVLSEKLAAKLFAGGDAVGHEVLLNQKAYRVVGVLKNWNPQPRFYDLFSPQEDVFLPFSTAIEQQMQGANLACNNAPAPGWSGLLSSECQWIPFWVELPTAAAVQSYRQFLYEYAAGQKRIGRFNWAPSFGLYDVRAWLIRQKVVPNEVRAATLAAFGFLVVCLLNAVSLMLAKFTSRAGQLSVHRALGASKNDVISQYLTETALIGLGGGLLGLALTLLGLKIERNILGGALGDLARLDSGMVVITLSLAVIATMACGLYPSWRAGSVQPAWQLKAQ